MWKRRKRQAIPTDVNEARALGEKATGELEALEAQTPYIHRLVGALVERRKANHFGDELTVTYVPRGANQ